MTTLSSSEITRRSFLVASFGVLIPRIGWSSGVTEPALHWPLEGFIAPGRESITGSQATLVDATGRLFWVEDSAKKLPRLDGYSVWFEHDLKEPIPLGPALTVSAWIALEAYPLETASVIEWGNATSGASLAIDRLGSAIFTVRSNSVRYECKSDRPIGRGRWIHLAATAKSDVGLALLVDGEEIATARSSQTISQPIPIRNVYLGRAMKEAVVGKVFPTNVLNGLVKQIRLYGTALSPDEVRRLSAEFERLPALLSTDPSWFATDAQRPEYHAMPPRAWTNEPHGLVHWRGEYHLFYQKNPNGPFWGHLHWGHMTSPDLVKWAEQPIALTPQKGFDCEGCWSGSAIVANDKLVLFYTAVDGKRARIFMASSEDGIHFEKYAGNPVVDAPPSVVGKQDFRDPFVWREGSEYRMIIGSGIADVGGTALLYRSSDLTTWQYLKPLLVGDKASSGVFWEMPVFVKIGGYRVLIVCEIPGRASYWVGTWANDEFTPLEVAPRRLDLFNHFLSPTPCVDESGRVIAMGIVPETRSSLEQWQAGWAHLYGLPREWTLDERQQLCQEPIGELSARFIPLLAQQERQPVSAQWTTIEAAGACLSVKARFERGSSKSVALALRRSPGRQEETVMRYDWVSAHLTLDRSKSSMNSETVRDVMQVVYHPSTPDAIHVHVFLDRSVLEVFVDGRACFSSRIYPSLPESVGIAASSEGGDAYIASLDVGRWL